MRAAIPVSVTEKAKSTGPKAMPLLAEAGDGKDISFLALPEGMDESMLDGHRSQHRAQRRSRPSQLHRKRVHSRVLTGTRSHPAPSMV